jgi:hypothetical protein
MAMRPERIGITHTYYRLSNALEKACFLLSKFKNKVKAGASNLRTILVR